MKEAILTLSILAVLILFVVAVCYIISKVIDWRYDSKDKKRRAEHPELYRLFDEVEEKGAECCHWYNNEIASRKRKVDAILAELPYCIAEERATKEQELESLRASIHTATIIDNKLESELAELRKQVKEYVEQNNLEWARKWGW